MPVCIAKRGKVWRCIECSTGKIVRNNKGTPVDGGGYKLEKTAKAQQTAINISLHMKGKI